MLDYDALRCFHEVLRYGGFEKGAQALNLTPSAVSQKIKRLEQNVGGPVMVRTKPLRATPLGKELLAHIQKVSVLEEALNIQSGLEASAAPISVAVNNDVLATWFSQVMAAFSNKRANPIHIVNADQTQTRDILQQGRVMACISQTGTPVTGGQSIRLGTMRYQLYASPRFIERYLHKEISPQSVMSTPGLLYDEYDVTLLTDYQRECLNIAPLLQLVIGIHRPMALSKWRLMAWCGLYYPRFKLNTRLTKAISFRYFLKRAWCTAILALDNP